MITLLAVLTSLALLGLGIAIGWFGHRRWGVGPPTPLPLEPPEPEPLTDAYFDQLDAAERAERKRQHDEWDAEFRKLCPPSPGVVWQRDMAGAYVKWPELGYSPKGRKITDFNN